MNYRLFAIAILGFCVCLTSVKAQESPADNADLPPVSLPPEFSVFVMQPRIGFNQAEIRVKVYPEYNDLTVKPKITVTIYDAQYKKIAQKTADAVVGVPQNKFDNGPPTLFDFVINKPQFTLYAGYDSVHKAEYTAKAEIFCLSDSGEKTNYGTRRDYFIFESGRESSPQSNINDFSSMTSDINEQEKTFKPEENSVRVTPNSISVKTVAITDSAAWVEYQLGISDEHWFEPICVEADLFDSQGNLILLQDDFATPPQEKESAIVHRRCLEIRKPQISMPDAPAEYSLRLTLYSPGRCEWFTDEQGSDIHAEIAASIHDIIRVPVKITVENKK